MDRFKSVQRASILGILGNVFLLIIKSIIGFVTNSQAMLADAMNSGGDVFSSVITFIGNKIASVPSDDDHNLGHGKAEYIYSLLISITMILMSLEMGKSAFKSLIFGGSYTFSKFIIVVCIVTILVKFSLYLYTSKISKKYNNLLMDANSKDHRNDCLITFSNLLAALFSYVGITFIDGLVGIFISLWIIITGIKIFKESYDVLMDKAIDKCERDKVYAIIKRHHEIKKVNHFNSTPIGYRYQISLTIFVDGDMPTFKSHEIADRLEKEIVKEIPEVYLAIIHVNPIKVNE